MYGLIERDLGYILKAIRNFKEIERVILFGSRAMGNFKKGSDVDLAIVGEEITSKVIYELDDLLNEVYPLPYFFDIIQYEEINNQHLLEHINTVGKVLYQKGENQNPKYTLEATKADNAAQFE
ncbi:nucleotidyltransferase family protein [Bacillus sp. REN16]|uniref:nucleotidyltransferase family protein n=1 Tax=Bacillus sp. REN16 TaxID=2887296 RepID=UPI001E517F48|nr:nucleotidyltransferase domain-containing protein [Bacillus sp. REN16]MCC3359715.1 nucleotidyltransferase domain-containing protein [Bacillus sp. REN16]